MKNVILLLCLTVAVCSGCKTKTEDSAAKDASADATRKLIGEFLPTGNSQGKTDPSKDPCEVSFADGRVSITLQNMINPGTHVIALGGIQTFKYARFDNGNPTRTKAYSSHTKLSLEAKQAGDMDTDSTQWTMLDIVVNSNGKRVEVGSWHGLNLPFFGRYQTLVCNIP